LTAQALKTKRHYNTFSPRAGFFVPLADVRAWFNDDDRDADATAVPQQHQSAKVSKSLVTYVHIQKSYVNLLRSSPFSLLLRIIALMLRCWLVASINSV